jgi:hypothetical protein
MSLTGTWENSYGSVMNLTQSDDGSVIGQYASSTGSTGVYWVVGHADPSAQADPRAQADKGQAAALSIYWRSIAGGPSDPSWHYVSGFSGQRVTVNGQPQLILMHAMVDSDDAPGPGGLGTYLDKLVYTPATRVAEHPEIDRLNEADDTQDPVCGTWATSTGPTLSVDILGVSASTGYVLGTIVVDGVTHIAAVGFTDVTARQDGLKLQSLTLAAFDATNATVWSLAGTLDLQTGVMTLLQMQSHGTTADNLYAQTTATQYVLAKVG